VTSAADAAATKAPIMAFTNKLRTILETLWVFSLEDYQFLVKAGKVLASDGGWVSKVDDLMLR
jgi:hypothetical protein